MENVVLVCQDCVKQLLFILWVNVHRYIHSADFYTIRRPIYHVSYIGKKFTYLLRLVVRLPFSRLKIAAENVNMYAWLINADGNTGPKTTNRVPNSGGFIYLLNTHKAAQHKKAVKNKYRLRLRPDRPRPTHSVDRPAHWKLRSTLRGSDISFPFFSGLQLA